MSHILDLDAIVSLNDITAWLLIERSDAEDTERVSLAQLTEKFASVKKVNNVSPNGEGNVNLTSDNISDTASTERKWMTPTERDKVSKIVTNGSGTGFLANDGSYKAVSGGAAVWGGISGDFESQSDAVLYIQEAIETAIGDIEFPEDATWGALIGDIYDQTDLIDLISDSIDAAFGVFEFDGDGLSFLANDGTYKEIESGGGDGSQTCRFRYNSSLFTNDEHLFVGPYTEITENASANLSAISYEAKLDGGSYASCANVTALLAWIATNVTTDTTKYWIKCLATNSGGIGENHLTYKA